MLRIAAASRSGRANATCSGKSAKTCPTPVSGGDTVQGLYEALLITMKNGARSGRAAASGSSSRFVQTRIICRS